MAIDVEEETDGPETATIRSMTEANGTTQRLYGSHAHFTNLRLSAAYPLRSTEVVP